MNLLLPMALAAGLFASPSQAADPASALPFHANSPVEAQAWQRAAREKLFAPMMGGQEPARGPLDLKVRRRIDVPAAGYRLEELTLQTLPDRRAHLWLARPLQPKGSLDYVASLPEVDARRLAVAGLSL